MDDFDFNVILLDHFIGALSTSIIPKSALEDYGMFNENIPYASDYELWLRYCLSHNVRIHIIPKFLIKYRVHETQLTKIIHDDSEKNAEKIRKKILDTLDSSQKEKFKIALKQVKKKMPLGMRIKLILKNTMFRVLPNSTAKKILIKYRELKYSQK